MSKPKEDPKDRKARLRERRMAELDRQRASENNAAGLSADLRGIYGLQPNSGPSMPFGMGGGGKGIKFTGPSLKTNQKGMR